MFLLKLSFLLFYSYLIGEISREENKAFSSEKLDNLTSNFLTGRDSRPKSFAVV